MQEQRVFKIKRKKAPRESPNNYAYCRPDVPIWNAITDPNWTGTRLFIDRNERDRSYAMTDKRRSAVVRDDGKRYSSVKEAAADNNITYGTICDCLRGRINTAGGHRWHREREEGQNDKE
jgi:hypothetical protein